MSDDDEVYVDCQSSSRAQFFLFVLLLEPVGTGRKSTGCRRMTMQMEKKGGKKGRQVQS